MQNFLHLLCVSKSSLSLCCLSVNLVGTWRQDDKPELGRAGAPRPIHPACSRCDAQRRAYACRGGGGGAGGWCRWFPLYYEVKLVVVLWLSFGSGADRLYFGVHRLYKFLHRRARAWGALRPAAGEGDAGDPGEMESKLNAFRRAIQVCVRACVCV